MHSLTQSGFGPVGLLSLRASPDAITRQFQSSPGTVPKLTEATLTFSDAAALGREVQRRHHPGHTQERQVSPARQSREQTT